jgi:3'(2'), 5'-bisphosphate nucleotidase
MLDLISILPSVVELARQAGERILEVYASTHIAVTAKQDSSPLTLADMSSHRTIVSGLAALTPDIPVLSEEASDIAFDVRRQWKRYWLVDPLDGTKEFVSRNGEFTVNIALIERHAPVMGVVHVPVSTTTYSAIVGAGAYRQRSFEASEQIRVQAHASTPLRVVGSRSHHDPHTDRYLQALGPHERLAIGSSLKFCLVAEGSADLYPRFGPTSEWDTAAAHAIVEVAGGVVMRADGQPLRYNTKSDFLNPHFLVFADRERDWRRLVASG